MKTTQKKEYLIKAQQVDDRSFKQPQEYIAWYTAEDVNKAVAMFTEKMREDGYKRKNWVITDIHTI